MKIIREIESALIQILYWAIRVAAFPLLVFYFVYRCVRDPRYSRGFTERLGGPPQSFQPTAPGSIWLHAVSVGEVISAAGLLREIRERSPGIPLYLSVTTVAGRDIAEERLGGLVDGIFHAPIDYVFAVRQVLGRVRPSLVVILETEIWPVLYREVKRARCGLVIANGRISDRAFPRYRWWRFMFKDVLRQPDAILAQSEQDAERYVELGAPAQAVHVIGNLKYDAVPALERPPRLIASLLEKLRPTAVWIAASTMAAADRHDVDEDDAVLRAFEELSRRRPGLLLILVPRKPERFDEAERKLRDAGLRYVRRTADEVPPGLALPCVVLVDSVGELASLFPLADVVFMGGTLARCGGHNLLEPAAVRRAIVTGPHLENFRAIGAEFREQRAFLEINEASELAGAVGQLIDQPQLREELGVRAAALAAGKRGATQKAVAVILRQHDLAVPGWSHLSPARFLLWPFAKIWKLSSAQDLRRKTAASRRLSTPVISVGGISMGGAGKTPLVDHLSERLSERGYHPAILTRGYRRQSIETTILIGAGEAASVQVTGDEAQIFVQSGFAHLGVGADRFASGRLLEEKYQPDVFVLDDGFQHVRLQRDLDLVVIDALNPFAGGALFPLGALREPKSALARAGVFVIMRAAPGREYEGIRRELRAWNPRAPIFRARVEPRGWVNYSTRKIEEPPEGPVAAFCGLANPASFWGTLRSLGVPPVFHWAFDDHHHYSCDQVNRLAAQTQMHGSSVMLTTEKDAMNLPESAPGVLERAGVNLYWLNIGVHVDDEEELLQLIESKMRSASGQLNGVNR
jgi:3-deoxy-D-manno-octulosonic-acid transferase